MTPKWAVMFMPESDLKDRRATSLRLANCARYLSDFSVGWVSFSSRKPYAKAPEALGLKGWGGPLDSRYLSLGGQELPGHRLLVYVNSRDTACWVYVTSWETFLGVLRPPGCWGYLSSRGTDCWGYLNVRGLVILLQTQN